jgi:hypothetical protein
MNKSVSWPGLYSILTIERQKGSALFEAGVTATTFSLFPQVYTIPEPVLSL